MTRIAVVGAGLAGLTLAGRLAPHAAVTLYEKSRGVGGRMATRYAGAFEFDHGAQFFTARSKSFRRFIQPLIESGDVGTWRGGFAEIDGGRVTASRAWTDDHPHYVGVPRMNAVGRRLAENLDVRLGTTVSHLSRSGDAWHLGSGDGESSGPYDWVVLAAPAAQTAALAPAGSELARTAAAIEMSPCYALMVGLEFPLEQDWHAARVKQSPISWVSINSSKPGRKSATSVVIHSTNAWAGDHIDADPDWVRRTLLGAASDILSQDFGAAAWVDLHRWRYANIAKQRGPGYYVDDECRIAACGDWFIRGRVEAAYRSGTSLADRIIALLGG